MHNTTEQDNGFYRDPNTIADRLTQALANTPDFNQPHSEQDWETFTRLAWRPAWSIRSRQGCLKPIVEWWRNRRVECDS